MMQLGCNILLNKNGISAFILKTHIDFGKTHKFLQYIFKIPTLNFQNCYQNSEKEIGGKNLDKFSKKIFRG